jgi:hypothetical protein
MLVAYLGEVTDDGRIVVFDPQDNSTPVDLELVCARKPSDNCSDPSCRKKFSEMFPEKFSKAIGVHELLFVHLTLFVRIAKQLVPFTLPPEIPSAAQDIQGCLQQCVDRVLRLPAVGSKLFLTNKVDRSVTGK